VLDFPPLERQALLETQAVAERARRLCDAVQFAQNASGGGGGPWQH
jgi:hypothetical protein